MNIYTYQSISNIIMKESINYNCWKWPQSVGKGGKRFYLWTSHQIFTVTFAQQLMIIYNKVSQEKEMDQKRGEHETKSANRKKKTASPF